MTTSTPAVTPPTSAEMRAIVDRAIDRPIGRKQPYFITVGGLCPFVETVGNDEAAALPEGMAERPG